MLQAKTDEAEDKNIIQQVILAGDMNINWTKNDTIAQEWKNNMKDNKLVNVMEWKWPNNMTWTFGKEHKTWIDHTLVSQRLIDGGAITKAVLETISNVQANQHEGNNIQRQTYGGANNSSQTTEDIGMLDVGHEQPSFDLDQSIDSNLTDKPNDKHP